MGIEFRSGQPVSFWCQSVTAAESELMAQVQRTYVNARSTLEALAACKANISRKQDIFFAYSGECSENSHGKGVECLILF